MFTVFTEQETGCKPPERESGPSSDGDPGRSTREKQIFSGKSTLVSDDTEEFEEPQTGVSLTCDPTEQEIFECISQIGRPETKKFTVLLDCCVCALLIFGVGIFTRSIPAVLIVAVLAAAWAAVDVSMPIRRFRKEARQLAEKHGGKICLTVYPDHLELPRSRRTKELPLDGTLRFFKTETAFALGVPPKILDESTAGALLILPFRCVDAEVLPYVEAMLVAGTRPGRTN